MCGINAHHERTVAKLGQFQTRGCSETGFTYAAFSAEQQNPHTNIVLQTRIQLLGYSGVARSEFARQEWPPRTQRRMRSEEHTSELQSHSDLVCRLLLEKKKKNNK